MIHYLIAFLGVFLLLSNTGLIFGALFTDNIANWLNMILGFLLGWNLTNIANWVKSKLQ